MSDLVLYDAMVHSIIAAHSLDEVLQIRDKSAALAAAAKIAKNFEAERQCREIRVRAERRLGELLGEMPKIVGDIQSPNNAETEPKHRALADLDISNPRSFRMGKACRNPARGIRGTATEDKRRPPERAQDRF